MKSVSFFRNALWRRDNKDADHKYEIQKGRDLSSLPSTSQGQASAINDCISKTPVLAFAVEPPSLHEGLDVWLKDPLQVSKFQPIPTKDKQQSSTGYHPSQHGGLSPISGSIAPRYAGPSNLHHGPPCNVIHGPPGLSLPLTVETEVPAYSTSSIRRAHRPPKIKVYPSYKVCETTSHSSPATTRFPARVKFVVPSDSSSLPLSLSTQESYQASNPHIAVTHYIDGENERECECSKNIALCKHSYPLRLNGSPTLQAILDPSSQTSKLYRDTGSSPHLPFLEAQSVQPPISIHSVPLCNLIDSDDPISLFPSPPPLVVRKKVPQPLILRPTPTIAPLPPSPCFSSCDFTPPATPATLRQQTPSRPSIQTPSKHLTGRPPGVIPPPLFSPPTSPLPALPNTSPGPVNSFQGTRPLRITKSTSHLRSENNGVSATHRLTCSEPISELFSHPTKARKRTDSRSDTRSYRKKPHEPSPLRTSAASDPRVQWGYAF
ncbi:hypothetical protein BDQ17DRAFT_1540308 [Cyathus striatus]|nr:hypothetical protein BDQ17DRAFT_1540308 [Cyathus striatus]